MSRVALLIGASGNPPELEPVGRVQPDLEAMRCALEQVQFRVQCVCDRPSQVVQEAIEAFLQQRAAEDHVLVLFAGYMMLDAEGRLYFATTETAPDLRGTLIKSRTVPLNVVQEALNSCPARHQVVILDCCFRQAFGGATVAAEYNVDLTPLVGDRRVILTASASTRHLAEPDALALWSYTRYLAEGITTTAADVDNTGTISAQELHEYARRKLQIAAPAMTPLWYGSPVIASLPLIPLGDGNPALNYRKFVEGYCDRAQIDPTTLQFLPRPQLDMTRQGLGLSPEQAQEIETQALRPFREYQQRLQTYQATVDRNGQGNADLHLLRQALYLTQADTAPLYAATYLAQQQRQRQQYQEKLTQYERVLLSMLQHRYSLDGSDRQGLERLQQLLGLRDEDVNRIQEQLMAEVERQKGNPLPEPTGDSNGAGAVPEPVSPTPVPPPSPQRFSRPVQAEATQPPANPSAATAPTAIPQQPAAENSALETVPPDPTQPPAEASPQTVAPAPSGLENRLSPAKEAVLGRFVETAFSSGVTQPPAATPPPASNPGEGAGSPPTTDTIAPAPAPTPAPVVHSSGQPGMSPSSKAERANTLKVLIIPAMIAVALLGTVLAFFSSEGRLPGLNGQPLDPTRATALVRQGESALSQRNYEQATALYSEALRFNPKDYRAYMGRALAQHRWGRLGEAEADYDRVIALLKELQPAAVAAGKNLNATLAQAHNNRSHVRYDRSNFAAAREDALAAVTLAPRLAIAHVNLANARWKSNEIDQAVQNYNQAIQLKPEATVLAGAYTNLGNLRLAQNQIQAAIGYYDQAVRAQKTYADAFYNRALAFQKSGSPQKTLADLRQAEKLYGQQGNTQMQQQTTSLVNQLQGTQALPAQPDNAARP
jgi:tetratricopeptide (TPR) repeat protein